MTGAGQQPGENPPPRIGVVVVNYASHGLLEENLARLDAPGLGAAVVVVDNFSTAAERAAVQDSTARHGWHLLPVATNRGFGAAVNLGVARARELGCSVFLVLNPDAQVGDQVVRQLVDHVTGAPMTLLSPRITRPDGSAWFSGGDLDLRTGRTTGVRLGRHRRGVPWLTGACLVVHDTLWSRVGGFDESLFLYWEDVELSYRCRAVGADIVVRDDLVAQHSVGGTQTGDGKSLLYYRWNSRNRLVFAATHLSRRAVARWLLHTPGYTWALLRRGRGRRRVLTEPLPVLAALRGVAAGTALCARSLLRSEQAPLPVDGEHPGVEARVADSVGTRR